MNPFESNGIFWWQVPSVLRGDPQKCAELLRDNGFQSVYIKTGYKSWKFWPSDYLWFGENLKQEMVDALHNEGIAVVGWAYVYGQKWRWKEADLAASQVNRFGLDGFIWNVEIIYDNSGTRVRDAQDTSVRFREQSDVPTAFCSWSQFKSPSGGTWHPVDMARKWMEYCDYGMPMVYWSSMSPTQHLKYSIMDWRKFTDKPLIPAGRAYNGDGGNATPEDVIEFAQAVKDNNLPGMTWWVLDQAANPKYQNGEILKALQEANGLFAPTRPQDGDGGVSGQNQPADTQKLKINVSVRLGENEIINYSEEKGV